MCLFSVTFKPHKSSDIWPLLYYEEPDGELKPLILMWTKMMVMVNIHSNYLPEVRSYVSHPTLTNCLDERISKGSFNLTMQGVLGVSQKKCVMRVSRNKASLGTLQIPWSFYNSLLIFWQLTKNDCMKKI